MPAHVASTSGRVRAASGASSLLTSRRMKSTSAGRATGSRSTAQAASVMPATVMPCHGSTKTTRPSDVVASSMPMPRGHSRGGSTTCAPDAGATSGVRDGSSMRSMTSVKGPVALMTPRARMVNSAAGSAAGSEPEPEPESDPDPDPDPGSRSRTRTPHTRPAESFSSAVTSTWFTTSALYSAAVCASATFMRESLCWPSIVDQAGHQVVATQQRQGLEGARAADQRRALQALAAG